MARVARKVNDTVENKADSLGKAPARGPHKDRVSGTWPLVFTATV